MHKQVIAVIKFLVNSGRLADADARKIISALAAENLPAKKPSFVPKFGEIVRT